MLIKAAREIINNLKKNSKEFQGSSFIYSDISMRESEEEKLPLSPHKIIINCSLILAQQIIIND